MEEQWVFAVAIMKKQNCYFFSKWSHDVLGFGSEGKIEQTIHNVYTVIIVHIDLYYQIFLRSILAPREYKLYIEQHFTRKNNMINRSESTNFSNLSSDLIQNFKQLFKFIDIDNDNSINKEDIQKLIRIINLNDKVDVNEMFPAGSDSITYPEFLSIMGKLFQGFSNDQQLREALMSFAEESNQMDLNKIDSEKLFSYLQKTDFYIKDQDTFIKQWKHFILLENGTTYFLGESFLKTFE